MSDYFERGFEVWADRCAVPAPERQALQSRMEASLPARDRLAEIGRRIFAPPGENEKTLNPEWRRPVADELMGEVSAHAGVKLRSPWPGGAPYAVCVTHDIDRVVATYHRLRQLKSRPIRALLHIAGDLVTATLPPLRVDNPFWNFKRVQEIESRLGVKSASYVLFERRRLGMALRRREVQHFLGVYNARSILGELAEYARQGNEVGIHGSFDSWRDEGALGRELGLLRDAGIEVQGVRNHYLQFDPAETPKSQVALGLRYDSTMGFNFLNGFRVGTCFPYRLMDGLVELPFQLMDTALRAELPDWSGCRELARAVLGEVRRHGGVLVLNWHLQYMNERAFSEYVDLLSELVRRARSDGAWGGLPHQIVKTLSP